MTTSLTWTPTWRDAFRAVRRSPGFAALAALTLALGIGVNGTMIGVLDDLILRPPRDVVHPEELYIPSLTMRPPGSSFTNTVQSYPVYQAIARQTDAFRDVAMYTDQQMSLGSGLDARPVRGMVVSGNYFRTFGVVPLRGRLLAPADDAEPVGSDVVVVSEQFWRDQLGGRSDVVGHRLNLDNHSYQIVGVAPNGFAGTRQEVADVWAPVNAVKSHDAGDATQSWRTSHNVIWLEIVARLRPGVTVKRASQLMTAAIRPLYPAGTYMARTATASLASILPTQGAALDSNAKIATLLAAMSLFVLLTACVNVANLTFARNARRAHELTMRIVLGASRSRLAVALLLEGLILAVCGGLIAIGVMMVGGPALLRFVEADATARFPIDLRMIAIAAAVTLIASIAAGAAPALQLLERGFAVTLRSGRGIARSGTAARRLLLTVQCASCTVLLVGSGLFVRSLSAASHLRIGFDPDQVWVGRVNLAATGLDSAAIGGLEHAMLEQARRLPGVSAAALTNNTPMSGWSWGKHFSIPGRDSLPRFSEGGPYYFAVSADHFRTMGTRVVAGRAIDETDRAGGAAVVDIDQSVARLWFPGDNPVGKCIVVGGPAAPCATIIGVVETARRQQLAEADAAVVFLPIEQSPADLARAELVVRTSVGDPSAAMRRILQGVAPSAPYAEVQSLRAQVDPLTSGWRLGRTLFALFAGVTLLLAAIGVYGVFSFMVQQRRREIGIRIAVGARRSTVLRLILSESVVVATAGVVCGLVLTVITSRWTAPLLFGVPPTDSAVLAAASGAVFGLALLAGLVPAQRASAIDPMTAMRTE